MCTVPTGTVSYKNHDDLFFNIFESFPLRFGVSIQCQKKIKIDVSVVVNADGFVFFLRTDGFKVVNTEVTGCQTNVSNYRTGAKWGLVIGKSQIIANGYLQYNIVTSAK